MRQYETFELRFPAKGIKEHFTELDLTAEFLCGGEQKNVKGYLDGDELVIRYLPLAAGEVRWTVRGMVEAEGRENCKENEVAHGPVHAVGTHFEYFDGTTYHPFGTTVYALASQEDELVERTLVTLKSSPFNKIRLCVFPKHYEYNHNEPPFYPFEKRADGTWNVERPCFGFWQRFETILDRIGDMGIQVDLILFHPYDRWGFDALSQKENLLYLDYLLRRLSAKPYLWWSLANEYDLSRSKSLAEWEEIESFVATNDPYGHLLSCHNCFAHWDFSRPHVTHASIQTKSLARIPAWIRKFQKPIIIDECCYEGNISQFWGSISGREMVNRFWRCVASGAYCTHGETYLDEGDVLWWAKGGVLRGKSPRRIAFLREIVESLPGPLSPAEGGLEKYALMTMEELNSTLSLIPPEHREAMLPFLRSIQRMDPVDLALHFAGEHEWAAHAGEDAYLWFNDRQCFAEQQLNLPEDKLYRIECIDTWEMTRILIANKVNGKTKIQIPAKEGLAVLACRIEE